MAYVGGISDVNMSSEGSVSSRLRQFGLYKTIDSRTEEFLKLSRKRQIRRGCACAVVSTAITVTVVVSALLIYQYGFRKNAKMAPSSLHRTNWFKAINNTDDTTDKKKNINNKKLLPKILNALDQKANYSKSCTCRNNSSIESILKQLNKTMQQIRSRNAVKTPIIIEKRKNSENNTAVKSGSSKKNLKHATNISTHKKISLPRTSRRPLTFKTEMTTLISPTVSKKNIEHTDKKDNLKTKVNESLTGQNQFTDRTNKDEVINKEEATQKIVYESNDYNITTMDTIKSTVQAYTENSKLMNISTTTERPVSDVIVKDSQNPQNKQIFEFDYDEYEEHSYDNGIDNLPTNSSQYFNMHLDKEKSEITEEYNWPNYMDSLSKIYAKTFPVSKFQLTHSAVSPTMKPFDLFSIDKVDPLEKLMITSTESPHTTPIEWFKVHQATEEVQNSTKQEGEEQITFPPLKLVRSKKMSTSLTMRTIEKPIDTSLLEPIKSNGKKTHEYALFPVIRSFLLRKEREVYSKPNSNTKTDTSVIGTLTTESEKFTIDLRFFSNEEKTNIYLNTVIDT